MYVDDSIETSRYKDNIFLTFRNHVEQQRTKKEMYMVKSKLKKNYEFLK